MKLYTHLSLGDREKIYEHLGKGISITILANKLCRNKSTISRELKRNRSLIGYLPDRADNKAKLRRKKRPHKIDKDPVLKQYIIERLKNDKWSPEIIAGRLAYESKKHIISHETIYKFIYSIEGQHLCLYKHLMYRRPKRHMHCVRQRRNLLPAKHDITNRPLYINSRNEFGHFEGDLTFLKGSNSSNLLVLIERVSRKSFIIKNSCKRSVNIMNTVFAKARTLAPKSITFDNGSEFKRFGTLSLLGVDVYFCKPASPWQKGQVERLNAQLHKYIPKSSDIRTVSQNHVLEAQDKLNNLPRKILNFLTPDEVWNIHSQLPVALQT